MRPTVKRQQSNQTAIVRYLITHWRGEQDLGRTFWINTVLIGVLALATGLGLQAAEGTLEVPPPVSQARHSLQMWASLGLHALTVGYAVLILWQTVGLWRCAEAKLLATGQFWPGRAAQTWIPLYLFTVAVVMIT